MGHYEHWKEDLALARQLGVNALRWGVPWYRVEPREGQFDWQWTDDVLSYLCEDLGIAPIVDLMHYGCPMWLDRQFASPRYPSAVAAYARSFAERYRSAVRWFTPLNEPIINALMCGRRGLWPPYLRGDRGYVLVMLQLVKGMQETVHNLKVVNADSQMVFVEAAGQTRAEPVLASLLPQERLQHFLAFDLLAGRVTPDHPLFAWLIRNGASYSDLLRIEERRVEIDVIGLNFYPQWSTHELHLNRQGRLAYRRVEQDGSSFKEMVRGYADRYGVPVMITETSAVGEDTVREAWLRASLENVRELRQEGVPLIGYTWFPIATMIDWRYRFGTDPASAYRIELGMFRLRDDREARWHATSLVPIYQRYTSSSPEA